MQYMTIMQRLKTRIKLRASSSFTKCYLTTLVPLAQYVCPNLNRANPTLSTLLHIVMCLWCDYRQGIDW
jgi:hypothetical protein